MVDITCSICFYICKRGVKTPCCSAVACRLCATREMTSTRCCYGCKKSGITTVMLKNDPGPRDKVEQYKWNPLRQRRQVCTPKPSFVPRLAETGLERVRTNRLVFNKLCFISVKPQDEKLNKTSYTPLPCWMCGGIAYLDHISKDYELRKRVLEWRNDLSTQVFHLRRGSQTGGEHGLLLGPSL